MKKAERLAADSLTKDKGHKSEAIKLVRTFEGHDDTVLCLAFNPTGRMLASGSADETIKLWDTTTGNLIRTLEGHEGEVYSLQFDKTGNTLASGSMDETINLWDVSSGWLTRTLESRDTYVVSIVFNPTQPLFATGAQYSRNVNLWNSMSGEWIRNLSVEDYSIYSLAFEPTGKIFACASGHDSVGLWDLNSGELIHDLVGHRDAVLSVSFDPSGQLLASAGYDGSIKLWDVKSGKLIRSLEGHTNSIDAVAFSPNGELLASKSADGTLRLWSCATWNTVEVIPESPHSGWIPSIAFHPELPVMAVGARPTPESKSSRLVHLWEMNLDVLLGSNRSRKSAAKAVHHTTAKIVIVGDSGVGKTGLGWRLAHGEFKEHSSTHGQQFWILDELSARRADGTHCEAILWDLAGQPDYRLTHALFLDDADLALILFDPTDGREPLHGVEFWLHQLDAGRRDSTLRQNVCPIILVGARVDRGEPRLTKKELEAFCRHQSISGGYISTSAKEGTGLAELVSLMKSQIAWQEKPATVTTTSFKRIKDYLLELKENRKRRKIIATPRDLRARLSKTDRSWRFTDEEMMTAIGHLSNYGYVRILRNSKGEDRILLSPELLNNIAASVVLEARRNPKGLGSLEERRLLGAEYKFPELSHISGEEASILLDAAALMFLQHNICFRETDPLNQKSFLIFPELINLKKPILDEDHEIEDGVAYTVGGAVENVYASLVVLLGYTQRFTRTDQWRNQARYEMGNGLICGFRLEEEREGELDLVLYFGTNVGRPVRTLFQGLFESLLARRNLNVFRLEPVFCSNGHALNRSMVRERLRNEKDFAFCPECSERLVLPKADEPIQLTQQERRYVDEQEWFAMRRTRFEQALFQLASYVERQNIRRPTCFISYAWGDKTFERWVENSLAKDLQKSGIVIVLDRWENNRAGKSLSRFVSRISECDRIIPVGTPMYGEKFANKSVHTGSIVAAEVDLISQRLMGTETEKESVMPILRAGQKKSSFPPLMWDRVHPDFRKDRSYFITAFDFILDLYRIRRDEPAVSDLRETLNEPELSLHRSSEY